MAVEQSDSLRDLGKNAWNYMQSYPDWDGVGRQAMAEAGLE
jgi:hypothetical protein